jgi:hypothetical protein
VRQSISAIPSSVPPAAHPDAEVDGQGSLMRGVAHGLILVLPIWLAIGYATFILR